MGLTPNQFLAVTLYDSVTKQVGAIGTTPKSPSIDLTRTAPARSLIFNSKRVSVCRSFAACLIKRQRWIRNLLHTPCKGLKTQPTLATLNWVLLVSGSGCIYKQRKLNIQACHVENRCWLSAVSQRCVGCGLSGLVGQLEPLSIWAQQTVRKPKCLFFFFFFKFVTESLAISKEDSFLFCTCFSRLTVLQQPSLGNLFI